MPHEKPRPPAHPSSPSFHTSPALGTKDAFHTKQLWARAQWMSNLPKIAKLMIGARQRRCGSADFVCFHAHRYLTMACQDLTPGLAPSQHPCMQPHFTPTSSPPTPLHFIAMSSLAIKLPVRHVPLGLASVFAKDCATLHIPHTPWQCIQLSLGRTPLFPSPKSVRLWGVHRHRTGWRLVGVPFWSTLQTV